MAEETGKILEIHSKKFSGELQISKISAIQSLYILN